VFLFARFCHSSRQMMKSVVEGSKLHLELNLRDEDIGPCTPNFVDHYMKRLSTIFWQI
jgi:hypothetical protein